MMAWRSGQDHDDLMSGFTSVVETPEEKILQDIEVARSGVRMLTRFILELQAGKSPTSDLRTIGAAIYGDLGILERSSNDR